MSHSLAVFIMDGAFAWRKRFDPDYETTHEMVINCMNQTIAGRVKCIPVYERGSKVFRYPQRRMKRSIKELAKKYSRYVIVGKSMGAIQQLQNYNWAVRKGILEPDKCWLFFIDMQDKLRNNNHRYKQVRSLDDLPTDSPQNYFQTGKMGGYRLKNVSNHKLVGVNHFSIIHHPTLTHNLKTTLLYAAGL